MIQCLEAYSLDPEQNDDMTYDDESVSPDGAVVAADAVLLRKEFHDDGSVSELPE